MNPFDGNVGASGYDGYGAPRYGSSGYQVSNCENLEASFTPDDPLLERSGSIDTFRDTYLGSGEPGIPEGLEPYQHLQIEEWRSEECVQWANNVCRKKDIDTSQVDMWTFNNSTGYELLQFNQQHFCAAIGDQFGPLFFQEFRSLDKKKKKKKKERQRPRRERAASTSSSSKSESGDAEIFRERDVSTHVTLASNLFDLNLRGQQTEEKDTEGVVDPATDLSTSQESASSAVTLKIKTRTRRGERGPKSWEFLIRLLANDSTNPSLIRWNDEANATFVLVQPSIIAKMWGARANNPNLSHNNFARGLRYHYNTGALEAVSERQFMYKCGPDALAYYNQIKQNYL